ncbi:lipoprotein [Sporosarcina gallistercoris]|uniref:Lipoprotein n=1 Tax=Sporosarcina gallistercoris TaxID=2762245 RepID=A0ABR8PL25_9BACL|nr:lipoprotein [Sporosarcina gallistercoris]MBD7908849.1 lipoprotein [Sporosarcina gallistercoris]
MKRLVVGLLLVLVLAGCSASASSLKEMKIAPKNVEAVMDSSVPIQYISMDKTVSYLIYHSAGDVEADTEIQDNVLLVKLDVTNENGGERKPHIYKLTSDSKHDSIDFRVNGESQPISLYTMDD